MTAIIHESDVAPAAAAPGASVRTAFDASDPGETLCQSVIELRPGATCARDAGACEEVLFVLSGRGTLTLHDASHGLEPETGIHVAPGERYELHGDGSDPLRLVCTRVADPDEPSADAGAPRRAVVRLADEPTRAATSDREFRIVCDNSTGCASVTQFVGYIPPGRTPDHYHEYDEVIYILCGEGKMHADGNDAPLRAGSCIHLPPRTVHCLERTSQAPMSVLGVFRPAVSPAAAYYPDGTPAPVG